MFFVVWWSIFKYTTYSVLYEYVWYKQNNSLWNVKYVQTTITNWCTVVDEAYEKIHKL